MKRTITIIPILTLSAGLFGYAFLGVLMRSGEPDLPTQYAYEPEVPEEPEIIDMSTGTVRTVTAYTSHVAQTDDTPCLGATGANICHLYQDEGLRLCAANFVPFGTVLYVEGYGECVVMDRMHSRHAERVDIYMGYDYDTAVQWGIKKVNVIEI